MIVDLRSDTVTRPCPAMMEAMASAPLGDDVLGDDPTVAKLEALSAELMGHDAAVFMPSGTMANQVALAVHCQRGDAALFDEDAHMLFYEVGAPGVIAQVVCRGVPSEHGIMAPDAIRKRLMSYSLHTPPTTLLCVENTHNRAGGAIIPRTVLAEYRAIGLPMHLDGARMFNAATAEGCEPREIAGFFESVSFCLSKGLGAPVGSMLTGSEAFIGEARRWRKRLGGGMRQSGLLAACGLIALTEHRHELHHDHRRARALAEGLRGLPGLRVDLERQQTNFVMVDTDTPAPEWCERLHAAGVSTLPFGPNRIRLVTHRDVNDAGIEFVLDTFRRLTA